ncbi:MAG: redoxin domain-containing protein [Acidobacteria bacterium]|nr:redoxin domain-containing protein [Acidobacteriota bacterium]
MGQKTTAAKRKQASRKPVYKGAGKGHPVAWAIGVLGVLGIAGLILSTAQQQKGQKDVALNVPAPAFSLQGTDGSTITLDDLKGKTTLMYFSEGVMCDPCVTQITEIENRKKDFDRLGIHLVSVMPNQADQLREAAARFGVRSPIYMDADVSVSRAFGVLGGGHHADLPGHVFVLVDSQGRMRWKGDYPTMFVSAGDLLDIISRTLKA